jgi:hypothetical protein
MSARIAADPRAGAARRGSANRALLGGTPWLALVRKDVGDLIAPRVIVVEDGAMVVRSNG